MAAAIGFVLLMMVNLLFAVFGGGDGLGFRSGGSASSSASSASCSVRSSWRSTSSRSRTASPTARPREESWLAAFGLTLTLVWIYLEFLRLIAILQGND